jgi:hypothetical protein
MASSSPSSNGDSLHSPIRIPTPSSETGSHQKRLHHRPKVAFTVFKDFLHRRPSSKVRGAITHPHLDRTESMKAGDYEPHSTKSKRDYGYENQSAASQDLAADFDPAKLLPHLEPLPILPGQSSHAESSAIPAAKTREQKSPDDEMHGEGRMNPQRVYDSSPNSDHSADYENTSIVEDWMQKIQLVPRLTSESKSDLTTLYNAVRPVRWSNLVFHAAAR